MGLNTSTSYLLYYLSEILRAEVLVWTDRRTLGLRVVVERRKREDTNFLYHRVKPFRAGPG